MAEPLERQIEQLQQENMRLWQACERNRRQELMEHLLCGEYSSAQGIRADLRGVGIHPDRDSFIELYVNVLEEPPKPIQTKDGGFASPEVLKYAEESYTNAELNVALIAETFGLNPSYLSREVKHVTGSSLLDLLQKKRLEHAVALLGQGKTMIQSAQESGFGNDCAMRRAMKKYQTDAE